MQGEQGVCPEQLEPADPARRVQAVVEVRVEVSLDGAHRGLEHGLARLPEQCMLVGKQMHGLVVCMQQMPSRQRSPVQSVSTVSLHVLPCLQQPKGEGQVAANVPRQ